LFYNNIVLFHWFIDIYFYYSCGVNNTILY